MKQPKFNKFRVILSDGTEVQIKTSSYMTEKYCNILAYHLANKQNGLNITASDVANVVGVTNGNKTA